MICVEVEVEVEEPLWTDALEDAALQVRAAARAALEADARRARAEGLDPGGGIVVLLAGDERVRDLNARFRERDAATNVLSFPAPPSARPHLGDLALAYGVCSREAEAQGKPLSDHLRHLVVHGVLHLLGRDHLDEAEAEEMEALERRVLAGLGVPDPYGEGAHGPG